MTESITSLSPQEAAARTQGSESQTAVSESQTAVDMDQSCTAPLDVLLSRVLLPRRFPQRGDTSSPNTPVEPTQLGGLGRFCCLPWAFLNTQRAEGEAQLQRVGGISGAAVPSSGHLLSTACRPFLGILLGEGP